MKPLFKIFIVGLLLLAGAAALAYLLWPKSVHLQAAGKLQTGADYKVLCILEPVKASPFHTDTYKIASLELTTSDKARKVPSAALESVTDVDPNQLLKVSEEGPVVVIATQVGKGATGYSVQWRFLNGQFAQRRELKKGEETVRGFQPDIDRPSILGPASEQANPRRLKSPSLLSEPATTNAPSPNP